MELRFADGALRRLASERGFDGGYPAGVVECFRKRIQLIRAATDERAFYQLKSLHFEKLKGNRSHQRSMRLNEQWRLILEFEKCDEGKRVVAIAIEDYH